MERFPPSCRAAFRSFAPRLFRADERAQRTKTSLTGGASSVNPSSSTARRDPVEDEERGHVMREASAHQVQVVVAEHQVVRVHAVAPRLARRGRDVVELYLLLITRRSRRGLHPQAVLPMARDELTQYDVAARVGHETRTDRGHAELTSPSSGMRSPVPLPFLATLFRTRLPGTSGYIAHGLVGDGVARLVHGEQVGQVSGAFHCTNPKGAP